MAQEKYLAILLVCGVNRPYTQAESPRDKTNNL